MGTIVGSGVAVVVGGGGGAGGVVEVVVVVVGTGGGVVVGGGGGGGGVHRILVLRWGLGQWCKRFVSENGMRSYFLSTLVASTFGGLRASGWWGQINSSRYASASFNLTDLNVTVADLRHHPPMVSMAEEVVGHFQYPARTEQVQVDFADLCAYLARYFHPGSMEVVMVARHRIQRPVQYPWVQSRPPFPHRVQ